MSSESSINRPAQVQEPLPPLEQLFAAVIALAIRLGQVRAFVHPAGKLPAGELSVLEILHHLGPQSVPQIARRRATSRQNIQILVNRLGAEGYVELSHNPAHKRSGLVSLTHQGSALLAAALGSQAKLAQVLQPRVSDAEAASAAALLRLVHECLATGGRARSQPNQPLRKPRAQAMPKPPVESTTVPTLSEPEELPVSLL